VEKTQRLPEEEGWGRMNVVSLAHKLEPAPNPMKIAVFWRAVSKLETHRELLQVLAAEFGHHLLILDDSPNPIEADTDRIETASVKVLSDAHAAIRVVTGWQRALEKFQPDILLGLDEPYCLQTWRFLSWAKNHKVPFIFLSCQNIDRPIPPPFSILEKRVMSMADGAWFLNTDAYARANRRGFKGLGRVIPLGVNPDNFPGLDGAPGAFREADMDRFSAGFVGRLVPEKGVEDLVHACHKAKMWLTIVGDGPDRARLQGLTDKLKVTTEWMGEVPSTGIFYAYRRMDVMVLPSRTTRKWKEQFGRVLVEAMASSTPIVASDSGEIPNVVGDAALLYHEGDVKALTNRLMMLRNDTTLRRDLVERGCQRVLDFFTWPRIAEMLEDLIREIRYIATRKS